MTLFDMYLFFFALYTDAHGFVCAHLHERAGHSTVQCQVPEAFCDYVCMQPIQAFQVITFEGVYKYLLLDCFQNESKLSPLTTHGRDEQWHGAGIVFASI